MTEPVLPGIPEDFDAFWTEAVAEALSAPLDYHRSNTNDYELEGFIVETISFAGMGGQTRHGWLAYPPQARRAPSFVWLPPYGRESKLPDAYGTREGMVSLSFNFHGEPAFHQERYAKERGYFAEGAESPETWIFRRMLQDAIVATRVLQAQVEADEDRIGAMGLSQGGGMSIWVGAWCPIIKAVCADLPFLGNIGQTLSANVYRYPTKELIDFMDTVPVGRERALNTLAYYDTVYQAARCAKPTQVSVGLRDPACRPDTVRTIFDALPGPKMLRTYDWGHDWYPPMIENNRQWLLESMRG